MNNAGVMRKNLLILLSCMIAGVFVSSCGLEEVVSVTEPAVTYNNPLYSNADRLSWYFNFKTSEDSDEKFIGTDVYYKIYNNYSTLTSEKSSILSVNTSTNSSAAATRMIDTYKYQPLGTSVPTEKTVFFPETGKSVVLRLKDYTYAEKYTVPAGLSTMEPIYSSYACVGIKYADSAPYTYQGYIPFRAGNQKSFDFFDDDNDNKGGARDVLPVDGDIDYKHSSSPSSPDTYYVQMFAVGVALIPETVSASYSLVLDLGSVPIRKGE